MKDIQLVQLEPRHAAIAPYLRRADAEEIQAMAGISPDLAAAFSIAQSSPGFCVMHENKPAAIFGAAPIGNNKASIWLLGTDEITEHPVTFYRESRKIFPVFLERYEYLENYVDARNTLSLRWLKWLGFTVEQAQILGVEGREFHHVWIKRKD